MLHPRYKSLYFVKAKWPQEWISTAEQLLRDHWVKYYKPTTNPLIPTTTVSSLTIARAFSNQIQGTTAPKKNKYFDELDTFGTNPMSSDDPITDWLSTPPFASVMDPIAWWVSMGAAGHPLARMALDFLSAPGMFSCKIIKDNADVVSIPATSTDVERAFSHGGLTVSKMRHSLSDKSVRAATVVGSWAGLPGAIPSSEITTIFNDKSKRMGKGKDMTPESDEADIILVA